MLGDMLESPHMQTFGKPKTGGPAAQQPAANAPKTFGGGAQAATPPRPQQAPAASSQRASATSPFATAGGLPPATYEGEVGSGNFEKRDDDYWQAHPLSPGDYTFAAYVRKAIMWGSGEVSVTFQAQDWDKDANRPGPHHMRPVPDKYGWKQTIPPNVATDSPRYKRWRSELVGAYTAGGWPEDSWEVDPTTQGPVPPWYRFFVHEAADGSHVPIMLAVVCNVPPPNREKGSGLFTNVKKVVPVVINGAFVQAPMPWEVTPDLAAYHKWKHGEVKQIVSNKDSSVTQLVPLDKDQFAVGYLGMTSWKDL
jgi:hypothetical protein